nr:hypothetical protein [uncultured Actinoplanes sp.]
MSSEAWRRPMPSALAAESLADAATREMPTLGATNRPQPAATGAPVNRLDGTNGAGQPVEGPNASQQPDAAPSPGLEGRDARLAAQGEGRDARLAAQGEGRDARLAAPGEGRDAGEPVGPQGRDVRPAPQGEGRDAASPTGADAGGPPRIGGPEAGVSPQVDGASPGLAGLDAGLRAQLEGLGANLDALLDNPDMPATQRHLILALMADEHREMIAQLDRLRGDR